ncbi:uncharacterized protein LOC110734780 [Chenopodium quinoa]|uniref:uncharacterized protein LOC110734780 n=1 Tax=Chenopodium quinoa TaxID=63459 RepID=UPI000B77D1BB|nr:uncharacterized protein LOC110734780 [Chenopodium quinoa]
MFEVALSNAVHGPEGECLFDGKLGCFPVTEVIPAKRSSIHRVASTLETKPIKNITQSVIRKLFIEQLLPSIKEKWSIDACGTIWVQQDNATPHLQLHDIEFRNAANTKGFNIHLIAQPPNNLDLNVLDLGFFNAIQAIQHQQAPRNMDELVSAVKYAYEIFEPRKVNHVFLSLQYSILKIMMVQGSNNYIQPHHAKERMERVGNLLTYIEVPIQLLKESMTSLLQQHKEFHGLTNTV